MTIENRNAKKNLRGKRISIIVPAYNVENTIEACLSSLLNQTLSREEYEIIVVDNGSTDDTVKKIKTYPVRLIHRPNCTVYDARNEAVKVSSGGILAFIDSDCIADQKWLESGFEHLKEYDLVAGNVEPQPSPKKWLYTYDKYVSRNCFIKKSIEIKIATLNAFVKKEVFNEVGGFENGLSTAGDSIFSMKAREIGYISGYAPSAIVYHPVDGWAHRIRRMIREGQGPRLKAPFKYRAEIGFIRKAWLRIRNVIILIHYDVLSIKQAWSQKEINLFESLGIFGISMILRALSYFLILMPKTFRDFFQQFALP